MYSNEGYIFNLVYNGVQEAIEYWIPFKKTEIHPEYLLKPMEFMFQDLEFIILEKMM